LQAGLLDDRLVEIEVKEAPGPPFEFVSSNGFEEIGIQIQEIMPGIFGGKPRGEK